MRRLIQTVLLMYLLGYMKIHADPIRVIDQDVTTGLMFTAEKDYFVYTDFYYVPVEISLQYDYSDLEREIVAYNISYPSDESRELINQVLNYTSQSRVKRSWPNDGLLPFIGWINSKITGVATLDDIENLKIESKSLSDYIDKLKDIMRNQLNVTEHLVSDVQVLTADINNIKHAIKDSIKIIGSQFTSIEKTVNDLSVETTKYLTFLRLKTALESRHLGYSLYDLQVTQTVDKCNVNYLSESLIDRSNLVKILRKLENNVNSLGLSLSIDPKTLEPYYSFPLTNCYRYENKILILLNIPVTFKGKNYASIYKVTQIPMLIDGRKYIIDTENTALITRYNQQSYRIDLSTVNLKLDFRGNPSKGLIQTNGLQLIDKQSCVNLLVNGNPISEIKAKCKLIEIGRETNPWMKINDSTWYYSGMETTITTASFGLQTKFNITNNKKSVMIHVPCDTTITDDFGNVIQPGLQCEQSPYITIQPIISYLYFNRNTLFSPSKLPFLNVKIDWNNEDLLEDSEIHNYTRYQKQFEDAYKILSEKTPVINWESKTDLIWTWVFAGLSTFTGLVLMYILYKKCGVKKLAGATLIPLTEAKSIGISSEEFWIYNILILFIVIIAVGLIFRFLRKILLRLSCHTLKVSSVGLTMAAHVDIHILIRGKFTNIAVLDLPFPTSHYNVGDTQGKVSCPADGILLLDQFPIIRDVHGNVWDINGKYSVNKLKCFNPTDGTFFISSFLF